MQSAMWNRGVSGQVPDRQYTQAPASVGAGLNLSNNLRGLASSLAWQRLQGLAATMRPLPPVKGTPVAVRG